MKIGSVQLKNITILAPLAGITNLPFRLLMKEAGCALVCSEMISSNGLIYGSQKTNRMLDSKHEEKPLSVQLFGCDPSIMAEAAAIVEASGASILDINFGCSVKKVIKTGAGAALMREPQKAEALLKAVRKSVKIPLTIKMRSGWNTSGEQALRLSNIAETCGVDAITMHPRTALQGFGGKADWPLISKIKKHVSVPVIGNGDIHTAQDALNMLNDTGCDAVMIGRAAIDNPLIFVQVNALLKGEDVPVTDFSMNFEVMIRYLEASVEYLGEEHACYIMRSRLGWFSKGLPHSSKFREAIKCISSEAEAKKMINSYKESIGFTMASHNELKKSF